MGNLAIDKLNEIREAESCGLTSTDDKKEPFIGTKKQWAKWANYKSNKDRWIEDHEYFETK